MKYAPRKRSRAIPLDIWNWYECWFRGCRLKVVGDILYYNSFGQWKQSSNQKYWLKRYLIGE